MARFTAVLEQGDDGLWSAYTLSPTVANGCGESREAALEDLRAGMMFWLEYMKDTGEMVPEGCKELGSFEVAA